jgi:hypothetical protein
LLHQIECIQSNATPVGAETPSVAPNGLLGSAKHCATVLTEIGKTFADCENAGTGAHLGVATELRREAVNRLHFPEADQTAE